MKHYQMALEGDDLANRDPQTTIVMKGPLSESFTQALNMHLKKEDPIETPVDPAAVGTPANGEAAPAMESQMQEVTIMQNLISKMNHHGAVEPGKDTGLPRRGAEVKIWGVSKDELNNDRIVEVASSIREEDDPADFVVVVDETKPGNMETGGESRNRIEALNTTMESIVTSLGGRYFKSLKAAVECLCAAAEAEVPSGSTEGAPESFPSTVELPPELPSDVTPTTDPAEAPVPEAAVIPETVPPAEGDPSQTE